MKKIISITLFVLFVQIRASAQLYNSFYGNIVNSCSIDTVFQNLTQFESLGIKELGSTSLTNTLLWLKNKHQSYGYSDISIDTFSYNGNDSYNLIVTKLGTVYPNTFVIVDGHYDTKNGPGANDNGSGTIILLETARLLKEVQTDYSVKFIHFSLEENGLVGSTHYVNDIAYPSGMDIKLVFNIDQVGGDNSKINNTIVCERDESYPSAANADSYAYTDTLAACMELYSSLSTNISNAYSSDYMPFQFKNYVITGLYEKNATPFSHSINDSISKMDIPYFFEVLKGAVGATMYFAVAQDTANSIPENTLTSFSVYPNPTSGNLSIDIHSLIFPVKYSLASTLGNIVKEGYFLKNKNTLPIKELDSGIYFLTVEVNNQNVTRKIILNKP
ncbi:MAG: M28 family peptidase [Flavobacteriales bacterium]|nr:M28 family peptidase [Flavobacteriales bacterium]